MATSPDMVAQTLAFFRTVGQLKAVARQGWVDRGITNPESVADHTFRCAFMASLLGRAAGLDEQRLLWIMLVHDLPEALVGDGTPYSGVIAAGGDAAEVAWRWRSLVSPSQLAVEKALRHQAEAAAMAEIAAGVAGADAVFGAWLQEVWTDYVERRSPEAQFAGQIDKLEALLQALEYREQGEPADVANFLRSAREAITHPTLIAVLEALGERLDPAERGTADDRARGEAVNNPG